MAKELGSRLRGNERTLRPRAQSCNVGATFLATSTSAAVVGVIGSRFGSIGFSLRTLIAASAVSLLTPKPVKNIRICAAWIKSHSGKIFFMTNRAVGRVLDVEVNAALADERRDHSAAFFEPWIRNLDALLEPAGLKAERDGNLVRVTSR